MKKISTLFIALLFTLLAWGQSPQSISYQAVLRDASNKLLPNQNLGLQISVLQGNNNGTSVYTETQTATTNVNGLYTIEIGTGTTSDNFSNIDWSSGPYYLKIAIDPTGGTSYTITGTSEIISVPYALYSNVSLLPTSYFSYTTLGTSLLDIATTSTTEGSATTLLQLTNVPAGTYGVYFSCPIGNNSTSDYGIDLTWAITRNDANPSFPSGGVASTLIPAANWTLQYVFGQSGYGEVTLTATGTIELKVTYYGTLLTGDVYIPGGATYYLRAIRVK